jgi:dihydroorotase
MVSLSDVCYKQIKDNFYYGLFGDFKLVIDKSTGCFNATKLCNFGIKKFKHWTTLEKSKRLLTYYGSKIYEVRLTNNDDLNKKLQDNMPLVKFYNH